MTVEVIETNNTVEIASQGVKGDKGDSFNIDEQGLFADLSDFDDELVGFTYYATDTGNLYIKNSNTSGDWSDAIAFKGDKGDKGEDGELTAITANSVLANTTEASAVPTALEVSTSELVGRGGTGNLKAISLGDKLTMSDDGILNSLGGGVWEEIVNSIVSGSPYFDVALDNEKYSEFYYIMEDVYTDEASSFFGIRISTDDGATFKDTANGYISTERYFSGSSQALTGIQENYLRIGYGYVDTGLKDASMSGKVYGTAGSDYRTNNLFKIENFFSISAFAERAGYKYFGNCATELGNFSGEINALRFLATSGNLICKFRLLGLKR